MNIRFYYKSFPCLHGASMYQYVNERVSLDLGLSLRLVLVSFSFDGCKGTDFFDTPKTF